MEPHLTTFNMSCSLLSQLRALPIDCLIALAEHLLGSTNPHTIRKAHCHRPATSSMADLAELLYYQFGSNLADQKEWNQMTRLQLEHELRSKGLLECGEVPTDWQLRLRLAGAAFKEKQKTEQNLQEDFNFETDQGPDVAEDESHDMETESDSYYDRDWKVIYTKNIGRKMVY